MNFFLENLKYIKTDEIQFPNYEFGVSPVKINLCLANKENSFDNIFEKLKKDFGNNFNAKIY